MVLGLTAFVLALYVLGFARLFKPRDGAAAAAGISRR